MPRVLEHLEPKAVFHFFEDLTRIPHGSRNTKAISDYCVAFAKERGLWVYQDALNNVIIKKPATAGYEAAPAVIVQGHLDMVAEKTPESPQGKKESARRKPEKRGKIKHCHPEQSEGSRKQERDLLHTGSFVTSFFRMTVFFQRFYASFCSIIFCFQHLWHMAI